MILFIFLFILSGCSGNNPVEQQYRKAEDLWNRGHYEEAKDIYEKFIREYPDSELYDDAVFRLGEIHYLNLYDDKKAVYYFKFLIHSNVAGEYIFNSHKYLADIYENSLLDYDKAIIEYQRLIDIYHTLQYDDENQSRIAYCYFKKGNYYQAIIEFDNLIERYPLSKLIEDAYYQRSNIYYIMGDCDKAKEGYNKILERFPDSQYIMDAKLGIAECLDEEGFLSEALELLKELEDIYTDKELIRIKIRGVKKRIRRKH